MATRLLIFKYYDIQLAYIFKYNINYNTHSLIFVYFKCIPIII